MTTRTVVYDSGMLVALLRGKPAAVVLHHALRAPAPRMLLIASTARSSQHVGGGWRPPFLALMELR